MNEQQGGITENLQDFFAAAPDAVKGGVLGGFSALLLHLIMLAFTIYSGYHGIHASAHYRAAALIAAVSAWRGRRRDIPPYELRETRRGRRR